MHDDEVDTDASLVRRLVAAQFPEWADLPIEPVPSGGTDNALYRLGDDLVVRLPRHERTVGTLEIERRWLPKLAPLLPLAVPAPVAEGVPADGYPWTWSIYEWLEGETATRERIADLARPRSTWPSSSAPCSGSMRRVGRRRAGTTHFGVCRSPRGTRARALRSPPWARPSTARRRRQPGKPPFARRSGGARPSGSTATSTLATSWRETAGSRAVIDWGCLGVGDPACDVAVAWKMLDADARDVFRTALSVDDATWARGRGWVLSQALNALSYYTLETNAVLVREAERWLAEAVEPPPPASSLDLSGLFGRGRGVRGLVPQVADQIIQIRELLLEVALVRLQALQQLGAVREGAAETESAPVSSVSSMHRSPPFRVVTVEEGSASLL